MSEIPLLLGIDVGGTKIAVECRDLTGKTLAQDRIPTDAEQGANVVLDRILRQCRSMIGRVGGTLVAIGAATPGIVQSDRILLAPNNPGWDTISLRQVLGEGLQTATVVVENDVKAAAFAEARAGSLTGASPGIYLNLGTGLAAAVVIDGVVLRGAHGAATEIAYQLVDRIPAGPAPRGAAPLENYVSGAGIAWRASVLLGRNISTKEALDCARTDEALQKMIEDAFDTLAVHIANLAIAIDPERIAVGGGLTAQQEWFFPHLEAVLRSAVPFPPQLVLARFAQNASMIGALLLAGDAVAQNRIAPPQQAPAGGASPPQT